MNTSDHESEPAALTSFLRIFTELAQKAATATYIYRGENQIYETVSSGLYRRYKEVDEDGSGLEAIRNEILRQAQAHSPEMALAEEEEETLSEIRHNGGETNIIDFTTDYLVALFFACDGAPEEQGQLHLLPTVGHGYYTYQPIHPLPKTTAQKSIHVVPERGFVTPEEKVVIEKTDKPAVLQYLRTHHGISSETIYNDLYGVIQHQTAHREAYDELHKGVASAAQGKVREAIEHYSKCIELNSQMGSAYNNRAQAYQDWGDYDNAIKDYEAALSFDPLNSAIYHNLGTVHAAKNDYITAIRLYNQALQIEYDDYTHYFRFESWLVLEQWEEAKDAATQGDVSWELIRQLFQETYDSIFAFEEEKGVQLPDDLKKLLGDI